MISLLKNSFLYGLYSTGLWRVFRRRSRYRLAILMYHGVSSQPLPIWTQVRESEFDQQMRYISENCTPISLLDAVDAIRNNDLLPPYAAVVTFDDGFLNNYTTAYPILRKYGIPATIFVTTSLISGTGRYKGVIWPDYVMSLFLETEKKLIDIGLKELGTYSLSTKMERIRAGEKICSHLKQLPSQEKADFIENVRERLDVRSLGKKSDLFRGLGWDEVIQMDRGELVTFGAHTVNHEILSQLPTDRMTEETVRSKEIIEDHLGKPVRLFAYPNGRPEDFNEETRKVVAEHFDAAVSAIEGLSGLGDDLYQLRRIPVGYDTSLWQFKLHLAGIYDLVSRIKKIREQRK